MQLTVLIDRVSYHERIKHSELLKCQALYVVNPALFRLEAWLRWRVAREGAGVAPQTPLQTVQRL
jgi:hypothetical protein